MKAAASPIAAIPVAVIVESDAAFDLYKSNMMLIWVEHVISKQVICERHFGTELF